jgi:hypothetical protein
MSGAPLIDKYGAASLITQLSGLKGLQHRCQIHPPDGILLSRRLGSLSVRHTEPHIRTAITRFDVRRPDRSAEREELKRFGLLFHAGPLE